MRIILASALLLIGCGSTTPHVVDDGDWEEHKDYPSGSDHQGHSGSGNSKND